MLSALCGLIRLLVNTAPCLPFFPRRCSWRGLPTICTMPRYCRFSKASRALSGCTICASGRWALIKWRYLHIWPLVSSCPQAVGLFRAKQHQHKTDQTRPEQTKPNRTESDQEGRWGGLCPDACVCPSEWEFVGAWAMGSRFWASRVIIPMDLLLF